MAGSWVVPYIDGSHTVQLDKGAIHENQFRTLATNCGNSCGAHISETGSAGYKSDFEAVRKRISAAWDCVAGVRSAEAANKSVRHSNEGSVSSLLVVACREFRSHHVRAAGSNEASPLLTHSAQIFVALDRLRKRIASTGAGGASSQRYAAISDPLLVNRNPVTNQLLAVYDIGFEVGFAPICGGSFRIRSRTHRILQLCSISQWKVTKFESDTKSDEAVSQAKLNLLTSINNLVERSACRSSLQSQRLTFIDGKGKVVIFEAHTSKNTPRYCSMQYLWVNLPRGH